MPQSQHTAVLLLAHGTPNALGEMAEYLGKVTGGRSMPPEVIAELQHRYSLIGLGDKSGLTDEPGPLPPPLTRWTLAQGRALGAALAKDGRPLPVYVAMRNWHPFIADVVQQMRADGVTRILAICLAPQNSRTSIGLYRRALESALAADPKARRIDVTFVDSWSEEPALIEAFAQRLAAIYPRACAETRSATADSDALPILFTAHSVPCRTIMTGETSKPGEASVAGARPAPGHSSPAQQTSPDPYPVEAKRTAELVFKKAAELLAAQGQPAPKQWFFAFQSQGVAGGPWIGPTVEETLTAIAADGHRGVVLQPIGFLCDHVEILYDIDIAFAETARSLNLRLFRPESLNDSPLLADALLSVVQKHLPR